MGRPLSITVLRGEQSWRCGLRSTGDADETCETGASIVAWAKALSAEWPVTEQRWLFIQLGAGANAVNENGRPANHIVITMPDPDALPPWRPRG